MWALAVVVVAAAASQTQEDDDGGVSAVPEEPAVSVECERPSSGWLGTLQSAFYSEYRNATIADAAYVEQETDEGVAYYVAVTVEGVAGVAVFGTSNEPLSPDPGLIAASNSAASQLSDLGADIPEDSSAGALLLDDAGTSAAESCLA